MNRKEISKLIEARILGEIEGLTKAFHQSKRGIPFFYIDELLPADLASLVYKAFPDPKSMTLNKTLREYKYIAAQMDKYDELLEEIVFSFQEDCVLNAIAKVVGKNNLLPDENLYAGGISLMGKGHFLNPHLDNSHDISRESWRVFNLLYYVSPGWGGDDGGDLELWPEGVEGKPIKITSKFNRLIVMATDCNSWHSVSPVKVDRTRNCISNYYFSNTANNSEDLFHVTTFRARPGNILQDTILRLDGRIRAGIRKVFPAGIKKTSHQYKK